MRVAVRPVVHADEPFLRAMLHEAIHVPPGAPRPPSDIVHEPTLAKYVDGFGSRADDQGLVAEVDGEAVGAAWVRLLGGGDPGYGWVDDRTPELTIAVVPAWRGRGIGGLLIAELVVEIAGSHPAVSLSVDADNRARSLYERHGFVAVGTSGTSITMLRTSS
jgi:ribosomal protein S18 acetylase RimI-like enzyme